MIRSSSSQAHPVEQVRWSQLEAPLLRAVEVLVGGGVVVYPTETVYGIGTSLTVGDEGIERVRRAKGSPPGRPFLVLVDSLERAFSLWSTVSPLARQLAERHWPGPLTLIAPAAKGLPEGLLGRVERDGEELSTVSVRVPGDLRLTRLLRALGAPLLSTSANLKGEPPPVRFADVDVQALRPDLAIDAGACVGGLPSTLVSVAGSEPMVLRQGELVIEEFES